MSATPVIGCTSPPAWFDPAPAEFPLAVASAVGTQQAPLAIRGFDYALPSIAAAGTAQASTAAALGAAGCDLVAQVGSPFCWAVARQLRLELEPSMASLAQLPSAEKIT